MSHDHTLCTGDSTKIVKVSALTSFVTANNTYTKALLSSQTHNETLAANKNNIVTRATPATYGAAILKKKQRHVVRKNIVNDRGNDFTRIYLRFLLYKKDVSINLCNCSTLSDVYHMFMVLINPYCRAVSV